MSNCGSTAHADDMHCMFDNEEVSLQVFQAATNLSNHDFFLKFLFLLQFIALLLIAAFHKTSLYLEVERETVLCEL